MSTATTNSPRGGEKGKPCICGMRIRVCDVLERLAHGASFEEIRSDYPCLERDDILGDRIRRPADQPCRGRSGMRF